jgi:coenzyme F420-reducing hydrogenase delta subunit
MADVIKEVLDSKELADLKYIKVEEAKVVPALKKPKVEEVIALLKEVEKNNGHLNIAKMAGVSVEKVKEIHKKMDARIAELTPEPTPQEDHGGKIVNPAL